ncbi:MAG: PilZ domain-containing protein [Bdellovibrionia bacterium]
MEATTQSENPEGIFIYSTHPIPPLKDVPALFKQSDQPPLREITEFEALKQALRDVTCGCVVFDVKEPDHLKHLAEVSHLMRSEISSGIFQFVVLCQLQHPKIETFLAKLNCNKVLYPPYTAKGLKIAITRHMAMARKAASSSDDDSREVKVTGSDGSRRSSQSGRQRTVREADPLKTPDDCWLTKASTAKSIHGKWLCFAIGPGPVTGTWTEVRVEGAVGRRFDDRVWEWTPKDREKDLFVHEGAWRFRGRFPEFKDTSWAFVGASPELGYYKDGVLIERKIFTENKGDLVFAKNSQAALAKLPDIQASIDFEVYLKRGGGKGNLLEYVEKRRKERELMATMEAVDAKELELQLEKELERASKDFTSNEELGEDDPFKDSRSSTPETPFNSGKFGKKSIEPAKLAVFQKAESLFKSRTRLFQLIPSDTGKQSRVLEACKWQSPVIFWTAKRQIKEQTSVVSGADDGEKLRIAYPKSKSKGQILSEIREQNARRIFLNINTRRTAIFFAQDVGEVRFTEESIDVEVPSVVYEVQRRENLRYSFTPETAMGVTIGLESNQGFAMHGYAKDISAGGIQVSYSPTDPKIAKRARGLEVGTVFPNISFELYGKSIHCSAQLRWKKEIAGAIHLGLQFVKISPEDREGVRLFVMEESFDYIESILNAEEGAEQNSEEAASPVATSN